MPFPGPLTYTYTNVSVGAASTLLVVANKRRAYLAIYNRSDEQVDMMTGIPAILGTGIPIAQTASTGVMPAIHEWSYGRGNLTRQAVNGICTSGTKTVTVVEGF